MEPATFRFKLEQGQLEIFVETPDLTLHAELSEADVTRLFLVGAARSTWASVKGRLNIDRPFKGAR